MGVRSIGVRDNPETVAMQICDEMLDDVIDNKFTPPQPGGGVPAPIDIPPYSDVVAAIKHQMDVWISSCGASGPGSTVAIGWGPVLTQIFDLAKNVFSNWIYDYLKEDKSPGETRPGPDTDTPGHWEAPVREYSFAYKGTITSVKQTGSEDVSFIVNANGSTTKVQVSRSEETRTITDTKTGEKTSKTTGIEVKTVTPPDGSKTVTTTTTDRTIDASGKVTEKGNIQTEKFAADGSLISFEVSPRTPTLSPRVGGDCRDGGGVCSSSCSQIRGWWELFSQACDAAHWESYPCKAYIAAQNPLCLDPAIMMPDPAGDYVCGGGLSDEETREAQVAACALRGGLMLFVEGHDVCRMRQARPPREEGPYPGVCNSPYAYMSPDSCILDVPIEPKEIPWPVDLPRPRPGNPFPIDVPKRD
ncbi:hypothetical protein JYK02_37895 [Corallococcus macrosporus]|uniref:Uncharacterized protein n=1 Tax=Corallococcus macrosporus TaxID=35 RepID=A0ABS3DPP2_9BACT|nr:hypothetical protein [Corallococcus macrosporus]MBN8233305.1 hypothetical protein [Corallococcus macrosporus]